MGLEVILEKIRASGDEQIQEIERNTQSQVNEILAHARMEAHQIEEDSCQLASAPAAAERARILHRARLEALRIVGDVRENLVNTAIDRARERLTSITNDACYPAVLHVLMQEALTELALGESRTAEVLADPRDETLVKKIIDELKLNLRVSYELHCWGGLIAKSEDGRVVVIDTFESRLEHATAFLRRHLGSLFEEEQIETDPKGSAHKLSGDSAERPLS
jgi:V/A-type H+-transporting ATPase subunit E